MIENQLQHKERSGSRSKPTSKRGCSWWNVILFLLFGSIVLVILGIGAVVRYYENRAMASLTQSERADFQQWLQDEIALPESFTSPVRVNDAFEARKEAFFKSIWSHSTLPYSYFPNSETTTTAESTEITSETARVSNFFSLTKQGRPMQGAMLDAATSTVAAAAPIFKEAKALIQNSQYVVNDRRVPGLGVMHLDSVVQLGSVHSYSLANLGKVAETSESLMVFTQLLRHDPEYTIPPDMVSIYLWPYRHLAIHGADPGLLKDALINLTENMHITLNTYNSLSFIGGQYVDLVQAAVKEGILTDFPTTRQGYLDLQILYYDFYLWKAASAPSKKEQDLAHFAFTSYMMEHDISVAFMALNVPANTWLQPLASPIRNASFLPNWVQAYRRDAEVASSSNLAATEYHLVRLTLARRIAQLGGKPLPVTAEDFVPEYLPEFPQDSFTTGPLRYSPRHSQHYSVGPDGLDNTADDIAIVSFTDKGSTEAIDLNKLTIK